MGLKAVISPYQLGFPSTTYSIDPEIPVLEFDYQKGVDNFVATFLMVAQDLCPVDTGRLISSIKAENDNMNYVITCSTDVEYAEYVEYGTYKQRAQPYFEPALEAAIDAASRDWQREVEEKYREAQLQHTQEKKKYQSQWENSQGTDFKAYVMNILFTILLAIFVTIIDILLHPGKDYEYNDEFDVKVDNPIDGNKKYNYKVDIT